MKGFITTLIVEQWVIMLVIISLVAFVTRRLETIPRGKQVWGEVVVEAANNVVKSIMGDKFAGFAPYIGTIAIYLLFMNLTGLTGFEPPTTDYSAALGLAIVTFIVIHGTAVKHNGFFHYLTGYAKPIWPLAPLNLIERLVVPVSLSLRLFGNMFAASVLMGLLHGAFRGASNLIHLGISVPGFHLGIFQIAIPLPFSFYFDIFDGTIQMVIFSMLTMIFIKITAEH